MDIYDFSVIAIDPKTGLYDFTQLTHQTNNLINFKPYTVQSGEEMRIDLVCNSIYQNTDNIDVLLYCNFIDNPLNILEGSVIYYPEASNVAALRYQEQQQSNTLSALVNPSKTTRLDPSRQQYVTQNYSLPPVVLQSPTNQVAINGNNLVIGAGLF